MRRRLTISMLAMVVAAVLLVGVGSLLFARIGTRNTVEDDLRKQAELTTSILKLSNAQLGTGAQGQARARTRFASLRKALSVEDVRLVLLNADNEVMPAISDELPSPVRVTDLQAQRLRNGETLSGKRDGVVYAASAVTNPTGLLPVVILTRDAGVPAVNPDAIRWFLLAALLTLLLAALVATRLGRQLAKPLVEASSATRRIASGDLSTRLPEHDEGGRSHPDEIAELSHSINQMAAALERYQGLERQFLLSVSHDLRTPLTSIRGYAEAIADGTAPDTSRAAGVILTESRRLERLVGDLLDLAKLESRSFTLALAPVDLVELVEDSVDGFRRQVEASGLRMVLGTPPGGQPVRAIADRDRLQQVVANLVENALRYASMQIVVTVVLGPDGPGIDVTDDGPGIAPQDLPHVFERLYRASHEPRRKETGSGLGLAIVRELVEAMGGSVRAEANPTGGARMAIRLRPADPAREGDGDDPSGPPGVADADLGARLDRPPNGRQGDGRPLPR